MDQTEYLAGLAEKSARDTFFYYTGPQPSAVRYKNWKFYYTMVGAGPMDGLTGATSYHWTQIANIKRDPFEYTVGADQKSLMGLERSCSRAKPFRVAPAAYSCTTCFLNARLWMR